MPEQYGVHVSLPSFWHVTGFKRCTHGQHKCLGPVLGSMQAQTYRRSNTAAWEKHVPRLADCLTSVLGASAGQSGASEDKALRRMLGTSASAYNEGARTDNQCYAQPAQQAVWAALRLPGTLLPQEFGGTQARGENCSQNSTCATKQDDPQEIRLDRMFVPLAAATTLHPPILRSHHALPH